MKMRARQFQHLLIAVVLLACAGCGPEMAYAATPITVTAQVCVTTVSDSTGVVLPGPFPCASLTLTLRQGPHLTLVASVDKTWLKLGQTATVTSTLTNDGDEQATGVNITLPVPSPLTYVAGTLKLNGAALSILPANGMLTLIGGTLDVGAVDVFVYQVKW